MLLVWVGDDNGVEGETSRASPTGPVHKLVTALGKVSSSGEDASRHQWSTKYYTVEIEFSTAPADRAVEEAVRIVILENRGSDGGEGLSVHWDESTRTIIVPNEYLSTTSLLDLSNELQRALSSRAALLSFEDREPSVVEQLVNALDVLLYAKNELRLTE